MTNYNRNAVLRAHKEVCPYKNTAMGICASGKDHKVLKTDNDCNGKCPYVQEFKDKLKEYNKLDQE